MQALEFLEQYTKSCHLANVKPAQNLIEALQEAADGR